MPQSLPSDNPYFLLPIEFDPHEFYGSLSLARFILEEVSAKTPRSLELLGLPGMGKSTLLQFIAHPEGAMEQLEDALNEPFHSSPGLLFPVVVRLRNRPAGMHPFLYLYREFFESYAQYRADFPDLTDGWPDIEEHPANDPEQAAGQLESIFQKLCRYGNRRERIRPVLLLDDFHLAFGELNREEATRLRPWRDRVSFILVTEKPLDQVNPSAAGSPFYQNLPLVRLGGLSDEEARTLIARPAEQFGHPLPSQDIELVREHAGTHPLLLFRAGQALWDVRKNLKLLGEPLPLPEKHYPILLARLEVEFEHTFSIYWDQLDDDEQSALLATVSNRQYSDAEVRAFASLELKGLVHLDPSNGRYVPCSPLFRQYLGKHLPTDDRVLQLDLTDLEEKLYNYLRRNPGELVAHKELALTVWGESEADWKAHENQIIHRMQVTTSRLRAKLKTGGDGDIASVRGQGYRLLLP